jgi:transcriptional regulator with XRE-family HTH domain
MTRNRDRLIDKKIGSVIRMQRVKLRMSQSDLGNFLGVTFQQIQKYENGGNAVASTRIPALCQTLEISPNDLFGVSARMDGELSQLDSWAMKTALKIQELSPAMRQTVDGLLDAAVEAVSYTEELSRLYRSEVLEEAAWQGARYDAVTVPPSVGDVSLHRRLPYGSPASVRPNY